MVALLSCASVSLSLASRDPITDLHQWNVSSNAVPARAKLAIAHFHRRSTSVFVIDSLCLVWAVGEIIVRTVSAPSLLNYFTSLGLFDITGKSRQRTTE